MTATMIQGHRRRDAMVAESEALPFDLLTSEEVVECSTEQAPDTDLIYIAVTLIRLMGFLG
jgi:hypothetical protein